jgi:hypothetical protein
VLSDYLSRLALEKEQRQNAAVFVLGVIGLLLLIAGAKS